MKKTNPFDLTSLKPNNSSKIFSPFKTPNSKINTFHNTDFESNTLESLKKTKKTKETKSPKQILSKNQLKKDFYPGANTNEYDITLFENPKEFYSLFYPNGQRSNEIQALFDNYISGKKSSQNIMNQMSIDSNLLNSNERDQFLFQFFVDEEQFYTFAQAKKYYDFCNGEYTPENQNNQLYLNTLQKYQNMLNRLKGKPNKTEQLNQIERKINFLISLNSYIDDCNQRYSKIVQMIPAFKNTTKTDLKPRLQLLLNYRISQVEKKDSANVRDIQDFLNKYITIYLFNGLSEHVSSFKKLYNHYITVQPYYLELDKLISQTTNNQFMSFMTDIIHQTNSNNDKMYTEIKNHFGKTIQYFQDLTFFSNQEDFLKIISNQETPWSSKDINIVFTTLFKWFKKIFKQINYGYKLEDEDEEEQQPINIKLKRKLLDQQDQNQDQDQNKNKNKNKNKNQDQQTQIKNEFNYNLDNDLDNNDNDHNDTSSSLFFHPNTLNNTPNNVINEPNTQTNNINKFSVDFSVNEISEMIMVIYHFTFLFYRSKYIYLFEKRKIELRKKIPKMILSKLQQYPEMLQKEKEIQKSSMFTNPTKFFKRYFLSSNERDYNKLINQMSQFDNDTKQRLSIIIQHYQHVIQLLKDNSHFEANYKFFYVTQIEDFFIQFNQFFVPNVSELLKNIKAVYIKTRIEQILVNIRDSFIVQISNQSSNQPVNQPNVIPNPYNQLNIIPGPGIQPNVMTNPNQPIRILNPSNNQPTEQPNIIYEDVQSHLEQNLNNINQKQQEYPQIIVNDKEQKIQLNKYRTLILKKNMRRHTYILENMVKYGSIFQNFYTGVYQTYILDPYNNRSKLLYGTIPYNSYFESIRTELKKLNFTPETFLNNRAFILAFYLEINNYLVYKCEEVFFSWGKQCLFPNILFQIHLFLKSCKTFKSRSLLFLCEYLFEENNRYQSICENLGYNYTIPQIYNNLIEQSNINNCNSALQNYLDAQFIGNNIVKTITNPDIKSAFFDDENKFMILFKLFTTIFCFITVQIPDRSNPLEKTQDINALALYDQNISSPSLIDDYNYLLNINCGILTFYNLKCYLELKSMGEMLHGVVYYVNLFKLYLQPFGN